MTWLLLLATLLMALSFYGWGVAARRVLGVSLGDGALIALGMGVLLPLGGVLTVFSAVSDLSIGLIMWSGVVMGGLRLGGFLSRTRAEGDRRSVKELLAHYAGVLLIFPVLFWLHHRPTAFNIHDDFEKYLKYPVRLLSTGNLKTGFFDGMGSEMLGGMSFLQCFPLSLGPLAFVNAIDSIISVVACMMLVVTVTRRLGGKWWVSVAASSLLWIIDPLHVNVSANYTGAAALLLIYALVLQTESVSRLFDWRNAFALGLACAAMVCLKTTLALMLPVVFGLLVLALSFAVQDRWRWVGRSLRVPTLSLLLVLPWLGVNADKYLALKDVSAPAEAELQTAATAWTPFSTVPMNFGFEVRQLHYTLLVLVVGLMAASLTWNPDLDKKMRGVAAAIGLAVGFNYVFWVGGAAHYFVGFQSGIRYQIPMLLAGVLLWGISPGRNRVRTSFEEGKARMALRCWAGPVLWLSVGLLFVPSLIARGKQAVTLGHLLGLRWVANESYARYTHQIVEASGGRWMREAQLAVPPGASILVWSSFGAFHLDYNRNQIWDADTSGFSAPWLGFPFSASRAEQHRAVSDFGIDYVLWQYAGAGVREEAFFRSDEVKSFRRRRIMYGRTNDMAHFLAELSHDPSRAQIVVDTGTIRLLKILPPGGAAP
ncbi:hypothetical protein [Synoicihabitans lomoniglobus]|uniref:Uncharacterized protein n=1 Tax=Synoicihabitans lomoniglobus TaxID=2909285 RepID=A0AAE9ZQA4_9BACT|nr:hypothetical protein [Opitutaceae bacterium LMO-M01]WED63060.1 hypothetical protein PXH66_12030 [Opitutaceae bacterium LMO-M01]